MNRAAPDIDNMLAILRAAWIAQPSLRLGQLIDNGHQTATGYSDPLAPDLFYIEDAELLAGIRNNVAIPQRVTQHGGEFDGS